jgi:hypothetical protein
MADAIDDDMPEEPTLDDRLARVRLTFHRSIDAELDRLTDAELQAFADSEVVLDVPDNAHMAWFDRFYRERAAALIGFRFHLARARAAGCGVYCVWHAQDVELCPTCGTCGSHLARPDDACCSR